MLDAHLKIGRDFHVCEYNLFSLRTSAKKAGLQVGDKILAIGGTTTTDLTIEEAVWLISGKIGTNVSLLISRNENGEEKLMNISIVRAQN